MRLLHCLACDSAVSLRDTEVTCACRASAGRTLGAAEVEYRGPARILEIPESDVGKSLFARP
jgi:hypothetical protein